MSYVPKILLVDDRPENLLALRSLLKGLRAEILDARTGPEALELLLRHEFAVAVIDVQMPGMDGFELAELMRGNSRTRPVPILFVTAGAHNRSNTFRGYESGAVDFLNKPLDPYVVKSKVEVFLELANHARMVREQLEETRKALTQRDEALRESREALQSRDEFFSIASHELKTPLTSLLLQLHLLSRQIPRLGGGGELATKATNGVGNSIQQAQRLAKLVDELLDLTRIRLGKLSLSRAEVNICLLAREVFDRLANIPQRNRNPIAFHFEGPEEIRGMWDSVRLEQIFFNLLSNAQKYGEGAPVTMKVELADKDSVRVSVRDGGPGIPAHLQERIFERFERAAHDDKISGLGLGLYITRQIARAHGGDVTVRSAPGEGSDFVVTLPRWAKEEASA